MSIGVDETTPKAESEIPIANYLSMMKGNDPVVRIVVLAIACHVLGVFEKASTAMC